MMCKYQGKYRSSLLFALGEPQGEKRQRPHWIRFRGGVFGIWQHTSGWQVHHCGHPTANWPYYGLPPGVSPRGVGRDQMLLTGGFGLGIAFPTLVQAQQAVEELLRNERAQKERAR
jgi:hypothetical protein